MSDNIFIEPICKICKTKYNSLLSLCTHLRSHNITTKEYYDTYINSNDNICIVCNKQTNFVSLKVGYRRFCSLHCAHKFNSLKLWKEHPELKNIISKKIKQTCLKKYGAENYAQTEECKDKYKQTCLEKYGVINAHKDKNVINKTKKTNLLLYGVECTFQNENVKQKFKENFIKKYNVDSPFKLEETKTKIIQSNLEKYGVENYAQTEEFKDKYKQTCLEKYGVNHPFKNLQIKEKREKTWLLKYGVSNPMQVSTIISKHNKKYSYNNITFDSSWELAYYIWLSDFNIPFIFHPNIKFSYEYNNKIYYYFPDFIIKDEIVEIKNSYLLNKLKTPNTKEYQKYKVMEKNNIKLIYNCKKILHYISVVYGDNYLKQFRNY